MAHPAVCAFPVQPAQPRSVAARAASSAPVEQDVNFEELAEIIKCVRMHSGWCCLCAGQSPGLALPLQQARAAAHSSGASAGHREAQLAAWARSSRHSCAGGLSPSNPSARPDARPRRGSSAQQQRQGAGGVASKSVGEHRVPCTHAPVCLWPGW